MTIGVYQVRARVYDYEMPFPAALLLAAQAQIVAPSPVVIENDQVRVLKVVSQPHKVGRLHDHKMNRVMIYMNPGSQVTRYQDGRNITIDWKEGSALWSAASGMHTAETLSNDPVTIVEIELKNGGAKSKARALRADPVRADPTHFQTEFENNQVRVLRMKAGPGESVPAHEFAFDRVATYVPGAEVQWIPAGPAASYRNAGKRPVEAVIVEIKK